MITDRNQIADLWPDLDAMEIRIPDPEDRVSVALGVMAQCAYLLRSGLDDGGCTSPNLDLVFRLIEEQLSRAKASRKDIAA